MSSTFKRLLATLFVLALAACGRDETPPPEPQTQPAPSASQAAPSSAAPAPGSTSPTGTVVQQGEIDTDGDLTAQERAAIASQKAEGEASTDDDGMDAQGNVRSHLEADTAAAEETDTPEEHEIDDEDDDRRD